MAMAEEVMLTTSDNPYNPFTQWDEWFAFDESQGYHTCSYLARIANVSPALSPLEHNQAIVDAIEEIVKEDILGIYVKVLRD